MLSDADAVQAFREQVDKVFGAADGACSDNSVTHWLPEDGMSARLEVESEQADGSGHWFALFSVKKGEPLDVNCKRSLSDKSQMIDVDALKALFTRIKTAPPPLPDSQEMQVWLENYGEVTQASKRRCGADMYNHTPSAPVGFHDLFAAANTCPGGEVSYMSLESSMPDMFAAKRVREAAQAVFGYSLLPCSHANRDVWEVSPQQTLEATYIADKVKLWLYDGPASVVKNCRR